MPFQIISGVNGIAPETGKVFYDNAVHKAAFNVSHHLLKAGTLKVRSRCVVIGIDFNKAYVRRRGDEVLNDIALSFQRIAALFRIV
jgi:hypothetical protein